MTKPKDRDFFVNAPRVIERAIGEQMDGIALVNPDDDGKPEVRLVGPRDDFRTLILTQNWVFFFHATEWTVLVSL